MFVEGFIFDGVIGDVKIVVGVVCSDNICICGL